MDHHSHSVGHGDHNISESVNFLQTQGHVHPLEKQIDHSAHGGMHSMTFHGGCVEVILFSWWNVSDIGGFVGSLIAIFIMALLYEGLKYYRKHLLWKTYSGLQYCAVSPPDKAVTNSGAPDEPNGIRPVPHVLERNAPRMLSKAHSWQTLLHGIQVFVSYMLMLVFMTYNIWLCLAVVLGSAVGYFLFGWRESVVVDFTEHCH